jgi:hypothetical protein
MSCRRAFDVDLATFLRDPRSPELVSFIEHYPKCPDCAAEVRAWTEVHLGLASPHPSPADLLAYADGTLGSEARAAVAQHLAGCRSCTEELRALGRFDVTASERPAQPASRPAARRPIAALGSLLRHPAFAYAVALLVVAGALIERRRDVGTSRPPAVASRDVAPRAEPSPPPAPKALAERGAPAQQIAGAPAEAKRAASAAAASPTVDVRARTLTVPVPEAARRTSGLEIRVRDAAGARELREPVDLQLPAGWLAAGDTWAVELAAAGAAAPIQRFTVRVP